MANLEQYTGDQEEYRAAAIINGLGKVIGTVDAQKEGTRGNVLLRFRPDGARARWVDGSTVSRI